MRHCIVFLPLFLLCSTAALASDDCKPNSVDVCETARTLQQGLAPQLPLRIDETMTMQEASADGRRLSILVVWHLNDAELQQRLTDNLMSMEDLQSSLGEQTAQTACGRQETANFIQLGGEIQYTYRLANGTPLHAPVISACPG